MSTCTCINNINILLKYIFTSIYIDLYYALVWDSQGI